MMKKILLSLCAAGALMVSSASAEDPFTVAGVSVDSTGSSAIAAMTTARENGRTRAIQLLINRLTLAEERAQKNLVPLDKDTSAPYVRAISVANEKRSANRYLGDMSVAFTPSLIQQYLRDNDMTMISTQSRKRLVLPVLENSQLWTDNEWSNAWAGNAFVHALTPVQSVSTARGSQSGITAAAASSLDMQALVRAGQRFGMNQILVAEARQSGSGVSVKVSDVAIDTGQVRDMGTVRGSTYKAAAAAVVDLLETDWKEANVNMSGNAAEMTVSVLYRSHEEWISLQDAINGSSQIQDARLDALSKDGAVMTLTYGGDIARLENELSFKGVEIKNHPQYGVVLAKAGRY